ncbi:hypothetical protein SUGI_1169570 [Cryptomeria japonica]|nr:hypothetical protein SUGI_1169570 [Cryptomeria japonica]
MACFACLSAVGYDLYDSPCLGAFRTYIRLERESGRVYSLDMIRLSMHPEVEAKILAELHCVLHKRSTNREEWTFRFEEVKQMDYLHATLSESLRLYTPIVEEGKEAAKDDILLNGTQTEKGAQVRYSIYLCGRLDSV